jgi:hypothetical protein
MNAPWWVEKYLGIAVAGMMVTAASTQTPALDPVAAVLATLPDDGQPALLSAFETMVAADAQLLARLAALGPAAHEAVLGRLLSAPASLRPALLPALSSLDARAAWALPLLLHPANLADPTVQELLVQLGPAAAPAIALLRGLPSPQREAFAPLVERLVQAEDAVAVAPILPRPRVLPELVPALLERLRAGPSSARWPALQALLAAGDEAVVEAVLVLADLELGDLAEAAALRAAVRCVYGARCLPGTQPLEGIGAAAIPAERRRLALAGSFYLQPLAARASHDPESGLVWFVRELQLRHRLSEATELTRGFMVPDHPSPRLARVRAALQRLATAKIAALLPRLCNRDEQASVQEALAALAQIDLRAAPEELWPCLVAIALAETAAGQSPSHGSANELLRGLAHHREPLPTALVAILHELGVVDENDSTASYLRRSLVDAAGAAALTAQLRATAEQPAMLARWLQFLAGANSDTAPKVAKSLAATLSPTVLTLPAVAQLAWFELGGVAELPPAIWTQLVADPAPNVRRRAVSVAWRRDRSGTLAPQPFGPALADADPQIAAQAAFLMGRNKQDPAAAVALLLAAWVDAPPPQRSEIVRALGWQHEHAKVVARPVLDAAFAADDWRLQLQASVALLRHEPEHAAAWSALLGNLEDVREEVCTTAWTEVGNRPELAARCVDLALTRLQRPGAAASDESYMMVRALGMVPSARERTLPVLRDLLRHHPGSPAGQRAQAAIDAIERAAK